MDVYLLWMFVWVLFDYFIQVTAFKTETVIFRVKQKHHAVKKCAAEMLDNHKYVGGRITTDREGHCEKLTEYPDQQHQTVEQVHGYFEKVYIKKTIKKTIKQAKSDNRVVSFPGPLKTGSKLGLSLYATRSTDFIFFTIDSTNEAGRNFENRLFIVMLHPDKLDVIDEKTTSNAIMAPLRLKGPFTEVKISIIIEEGQMKFRVNDMPIPNGTITVTTWSLRRMRYVRIDKFYSDISSFEFEKQEK